MKKTALFLVAAIAVVTLSAAPRIESKEKKLADGRTTYNKSVYLNNGWLRITYTTRDGVNTERKKYGESFSGLSSGNSNISTAAGGPGSSSAASNTPKKVC